MATQMGFCVVGVFLNNVAFITLKELPSMRASTYNILLCHIVLGTRAALLLLTSNWLNYRVDQKKLGSQKVCKLL